MKIKHKNIVKLTVSSSVQKKKDRFPVDNFCQASGTTIALHHMEIQSSEALKNQLKIISTVQDHDFNSSVIV